MKKLIEKKQIYLQLDSRNPEDAFGRLRGIIYLNNRNINIEMLKAGYSQIYVSIPSIIGTNDWIAFEKEAMDGKKGLWGEKKISQTQSGSVIEKLKDYFFPNTSTVAPVPSIPSSYDSFLGSQPSDSKIDSTKEKNSTSTEKTLPAL